MFQQNSAQANKNEYKSSTVNGLNNKYGYANSYVCKRLQLLCSCVKLHLKCSLIMGICMSVFVFFFFLLLLLLHLCE